MRPGIPDRRAPRRRRVLAMLGTAFLVASLAWLAIGVPTFVKYPTDMEAAPAYTGEFVLFADPDTFAPLEAPLETPLSIDRQVEARGDESGASRAVIDEVLTEEAGDLLRMTQHNVYVIDRRSMENVDDPRAFAFDAGNRVDRTGTYRLQLPMDADPDGVYTMYDNEWDATYRLTGTGETERVEGLDLSLFTTTEPPRPISEAYLRELQQAFPLPEAATLAQLEPQLAAMGIDVPALLAGLMPLLTPEETAALMAFAEEPIALEYLLGFAGTLGVDAMTGTQVAVRDAVQTLAVRPLLGDLSGLRAVLDRHAGEPAAEAVTAALDVVATADPIPVVEFRYDQTPESIADVAALVKDQRRLMRVAETWLPFGLAAVGMVLLTAWFVTMRPPAPAPYVPTPADSGIAHERIEHQHPTPV